MSERQGYPKADSIHEAGSTHTATQARAGIIQRAGRLLVLIGYQVVNIEDMQLDGPHGQPHGVYSITLLGRE